MPLYRQGGQWRFREVRPAEVPKAAPGRLTCQELGPHKEKADLSTTKTGFRGHVRCIDPVWSGATYRCTARMSGRRSLVADFSRPPLHIGGAIRKSSLQEKSPITRLASLLCLSLQHQGACMMGVCIMVSGCCSLIFMRIGASLSDWWAVGHFSSMEWVMQPAPW